MTGNWPTATTRVAGVIGHPVRHSLSPVLFNAAFRALDLDWAFLAFDVPEGEAPAALDGVRALGLDGLSVTMPHKETVAKAVDRLSHTAERLAAVNCLVRRGAELVGHNTDGAGFIDALRTDEGFDPDGRRCLVLGAGGAARAVVLALAEAGASEVVVAGRTRSRAEVAADLAGPVGKATDDPSGVGADLVVNATPVGMDVQPGIPIDAEELRPGCVVVDLIYHPPHTQLLEAARARGAVAVNGLGMLIHQAAHGFRLWTGEDPPLEVMSAAAVAAIAGRRG
ncbi:MAG TPA: shikimate dehydrogenase [Acidimicrobiales bacterium]|nr:shikimate dehydrogenase [Acidimicrobiales bacterium]